MAMARREVALAVPAAALVAATYALLALRGGALGIPRHDDWAFEQVAAGFAQHHGIALNGWEQMFFLGQVLIAWPVLALTGGSITALQLLVVLMGAASLVLSYVLVRAFLPALLALLAMACLAVGPVMGTVSTSFMSDVPALALEVAALLLGLRALTAGRRADAWLVAALLVAMLAFTVREYAAAVVVALAVHVGLQALQSASWRPYARRAALLVVWFAVAAVLYRWRASLPFTVLRPVAAQGDPTPAALLYGVVTLGALVAPASAVGLVVLVRRRHERRRLALLVVLLADAALLVVLLTRRAFVGNYFSNEGSYSWTLPGSPPDVLPIPVWVVISVAATVSAAYLVALALDTALDVLSSSDPVRRALAAGPAVVLSAAFAGATLVLVLGARAVGATELYDRYLLPIVPVVAALALRPVAVELAHRGEPSWGPHGRGRRQVLAVAAVGTVVFAAVGLSYVDAAATLDGAKWRLAAQVQRATGVPAADIDGGFEWYAANQGSRVLAAPATLGHAAWVDMFPRHAVCYTSEFVPATAAVASVSGVSRRPVVTVTAPTLWGVTYRLQAVPGPDTC